MGTVPYILLLGTAIMFGLAGLGAMLMLRRAPKAKARRRAASDPRRASSASRRASAGHAAMPTAAKATPSAAKPAPAVMPLAEAAPPPAPRLRPADICPTLDDDYDMPTQIFLRDELPASGFADTVTLEPGSTPPRPVFGQAG